ncbi:MAG: hypothetical protein JO101_09960, partial [Candidatus Eremiobacteraeota bacterium]|nr:hypothetical protein [Candidatus Eremiobacteraeota bacterium]
DAVAHRHAQTFLELAASFDRVFFYEVEEASVELARAELGNWRAALQWTIADRGDVVLGQRIFGQLGVGFWLTLNSVPEGHGWLVRAVEAIDAATPVDALGRLQLARGAMALQYGEFEEGFATIQRAVESCRAAGDTFGTARAQQAAVAYLEFLGRVSEAKTMQEDLLPLVRSFGSARLLGMALMRLVYINAMQKEYAAARGLVAEARHSFDAIGCIFGVVEATEALSWIEFLAGDTELALRYMLEAVTLHREELTAGQLATTLEMVPTYLIALARYDEAERTAREMLELSREHHLDYMAATGLQHLATVIALRASCAGEDAGARLTRAGRILGFVDARLKSMSSQRKYFHQPAYDRVVAALRDGAGAERTEHLMAEGARMSEDDAIELALNGERLGDRVLF